MASLLDQLSNNLSKDQLKNAERFVLNDEGAENKINVNTKKFKSKNNRNFALKETIQRERLEYLVKHPQHFDLGSKHVRGKKLNKAGQLIFLQNYLSRTNKYGECVN